MKTSLVTRIHCTTSLTVDRDRMIDCMGENAPVYAMPLLVRDIEMACRDLMLVQLDPREDPVGSRVEIDHLAATLQGLADDSMEPICPGRHSRFIVDVAKTSQRLAANAPNAAAAQSPA